MIMLPVRNRNSWLPSVFDDFFDTGLAPRKRTRRLTTCVESLVTRALSRH